jgi:hypothetical protein
MLVLMADRWSKPPLSVRVSPIAGGNRPFTVLGLPRMILCAVYVQPPLCLSDGISCIVPGIKSLAWSFHRLLRAGIIVHFLAFSTLDA